MLSQETKNKISEKLKNISKSDETKRKIRETKQEKFKYLYCLTKEEEQQLVDDYVKNYYTLKKLQSKYNISKKTVTVYLKRNNVELRDRSECQKIHLSDEIIKNIIDLYTNEVPISQICKKLNLTRSVVFNIIKDNFKEIRSNSYYLKGVHRTDEVKQKISQKNKGHWVNLEQQIATKRKNNSFHISKPEEKLFEELKSKYGEENVIPQYKDKERYPYYCDFYIKSEDLFIELNAHWTHGGRPYDKDDDFCKEQLERWIEKSKQSKFYEKAIHTWTVVDVKKQQCAKEHNLNYMTIY